MTTIPRLGRALIAVAVLSLPALALAEQPIESCDHDGMKDPTAEKGNAKPGDQNGKTDNKKSDDKQNDKKADDKEADKS
jgi:hypothetical protein